MRIDIHRYAELETYIKQFHLGLFEILIIEGKPGVGKSSIVKHGFSHLDPTTDFLWVEGRVTAAALYRQLYDYVDMPVILDDTDSFLSDKQSQTLLKTLCQTDTTKRVSWLTMRLPNDLPPFFYTSSRVIILTNETRKANIHLQSIQDRGLHILFKPSKQEIHQYAQKLCNEEVYEFITRFMSSIDDLTLRLYTTAQKAYDMGVPYQKTLLLSWDLDPLVKVFYEIELESPHLSRDEKKLLFLKVTNKQERTYDRVLSQVQHTLQESTTTPGKPDLTHTTPGKATTTPGKAVKGQHNHTRET